MLSGLPPEAISTRARTDPGKSALFFSIVKEIVKEFVRLKRRTTYTPPRGTRTPPARQRRRLSAAAIRVLQGPGRLRPEQQGAQLMSVADVLTGSLAAQQDPDAFFTLGKNGRQRFDASEMAEWLKQETPIAKGGEQLYVYKSGVYVPGESNLKMRIARCLQQRGEWSRSRQEEIIGFLRAIAPELSDRPSRQLINCLNGVFDRETAELRSHDPDLLTPVRLGAAYDPDAECPAIEAFLKDCLPDPAVRKTFYEWLGYLIVPDNSLQVAAMFLGPGSNGKSTALSLIRALLGRQNCSAVPLHQLEEDRFAVAELYGKLANVFADLDARALASSSMFKAITGADLLRAERKFRDSFTFHPFARLLFSANEAPPTPDGSDAFFRRWQIFPFNENFEGREDRRLLERLTTRDELAGLLNFALVALPELEENGFSESDASQRAKEQFRVDSDSVAGFAHESCDVGSNAQVPRPRLYEAYGHWCDEANRRPLSRQRFNKRLQALHPQLDLRKIQGIETWCGIGLRGGS